MQQIMVDTGAIYALVARNDLHHAEAQSFLRQGLTSGYRFVLSDWVFSETMTLLKARLGAVIALRVGSELRRNPCYLWMPMINNDEQSTWLTFQKYSDHEWSFTDCAIFALARRLKVYEVFAFDRHFEQMPGLTRIP